MPSSFKILSDFDGVWTDQGAEAQALIDWMLRELARLAGVTAEVASRELAPIRAAIAEHPAEHGWAPDGRISAYADEDPLLEPGALTNVLAQAKCATSRRYADAVHAAGFANMAEFSEHAFVRSTAEFRTKHPPCLVANARERLQALQHTGAEVVIVSNSGADKICAWFQAAGVDASEQPGHELRVRGSAKKWWLGPSEDALQIEGRTVRVDRPHYREAIEQENPDVVIGDVFSLDLALPHFMRQAGEPTAPRLLALRAHPHTPRWVAQNHAGGAIDHIVRQVEELQSFAHR